MIALVCGTVITSNLYIRDFIDLHRYNYLSRFVENYGLMLYMDVYVNVIIVNKMCVGHVKMRPNHVSMACEFHCE